ncbi:MAG: hypothetical protein IKS63_05245, partial [Firmicutes bacterium]|nr:hypothetical protein [Bacillota bacterium]
MKKRTKAGFMILLTVCVIFLAAMVLCACGGEPLQKAYDDLKKAGRESIGYTPYYDESKDLLQVGFSDSADLDEAFDILNKNIQDEDVGGIYFRTSYTVDSDFISKLDEKIGDISCKSLSMLGVSTEIASYGKGKWLKNADKAEIIYVPGLWLFSDNSSNAESDLEKIEKVWTSDTGFRGVSTIPNVKEIGVAAEIEMLTDPSDTSEEQTDSSASTDSEQNDDSNSEEEPVYSFSPTYGGPESFLELKKAKKLDHILVAPCSQKYKLEYTGGEYIFALQNVRPNVLINEPEKELDKDNLIRIKDVDISNTEGITMYKQNVLEDFLELETEKVYKKCIKFKKSSKTPKVRGKALVYMATPDSTDWSKSRRYSSSGKLLFSNEIGNRIKTPSRAGDYSTFIYAYPVYKHTGKYTS